MRKIRSFRQILGSSFFLLTLLLSLINFQAGNIVLGHSYSNTILGYNESLASLHIKGIESYFEQLENYMILLSVNRDLARYAQNRKEFDASEELKLGRTVRELLGGIKSVNPGIKDVFLLDSSGISIFESDRTVKREKSMIYREWFPLKSERIIRYSQSYLPDYYLNPTADDKNRVVTVLVPLKSPSSMMIKGYVAANLYVNELKKRLGSFRIEENGAFFILTGEGEPVYIPSQLKEFSSEDIKEYRDEKNEGVLLNSRESYLFFNRSIRTGWIIGALIPKSDIEKHLSLFKIVILILSGLPLGASIPLIFWLSNRLTHPLHQFAESLETVGHSHEGVPIDNSSLEMLKLTETTGQMVMRIEGLNRDLYTYQIKSREAELKNLQSRINPHFLNNTLQTIKALAALGKKEKLLLMIEGLSGLLDYGLYGKRETVTLREEIDQVEQYFSIIKMRKGEGLKLEIQLDDSCNKGIVIPFSLQPVVENAINHGLKNREEGTVSISGKILGNLMTISVCDNGQGMNEERLKTVQSALNSENYLDGSLGLKNVHDRLRIRGGEECGLSLESKPSEGTEVHLIFPYNH